MEITEINPKPRSKLLSLVRILVYMLLLAPLVFWKPLDFFFDSTKAFFIMGVTEWLLVCYLWLIALHPQWRPRITPVSVALFIFISVLSLASLLGVDPFFSFWSSIDRMGGVLLWIHLGIAFLVTTSVFRTQEDWHGLFFFGSLVGIIVSFIYLFTLISPDVFVYSKGGSTLGNSTFFGTYLIFCIFFSAILRLTGSSIRLRRYGVLSTFFFLCVLWSTAAQAAVISMAGGLVFAFSLKLIVSTRSLARNVIGYSILAGLIIFFFWSTVQVLQSGTDIHQWFIERSSGGRFAVWSVAWEAFQERPLLGWGLENFPVAFFSHFNPCFGSLECGSEYWFDQAHNIVLDLLVEAGAVGLFSYVSLFIIALLGVFQAYRKRVFGVSVPIIFSTFLVVYGVQNLAEFDVALTLFLFIFTLAYASAACGVSSIRSLSSGFSMGLKGVWASLATIALPFVLFHTVIYPIETNRTELVAQAVTIDERLAAYRAIANGSPIGVDLRRVVLAGETVKWVLRMSDEERERFAQPVQEELHLGIQVLGNSVGRSPNYLRGSSLMGFLFQLDARYFKPYQFQHAEAVLLTSLALNPRNQQAYAPLAAVYLDQGKVDEAFALLQQAIDLYPSDPQASLRLLVAVKLVRSDAEFEIKKQELLDLFPELQSKISSISQVRNEQLDQLYAVFY